MDRLGLGYDVCREINPGLVYCSVSAFGQTGPYAQRPGFDLLGQALSGMISVNGEKGGHPIKHGVTIADYFAGPNAYAAIMTAAALSAPHRQGPAHRRLPAPGHDLSQQHHRPP